MLINSGNFSKNGNFSGYNTRGERVHIYKRQMDALSITVDPESKDGKPSNFKPFFVIAQTKTYGARLDAAGQPIPYADGKLTMTRTTATAVFKTEDDYINAHVVDATLDAKVQAAVKKEYTAAGVNVASLEALAG